MDWKGYGIDQDLLWDKPRKLFGWPVLAWGLNQGQFGYEVGVILIQLQFSVLLTYVASPAKAVSFSEIDLYCNIKGLSLHWCYPVYKFVL